MKTLLLFWSRHEPELRSWLRARMPVSSDVEDVLQDSFVKAMGQGDRVSDVT